MRKRLAFYVAALAVLVLLACQSKKETENETASQAVPEPDYVTVQHILIGFSGSVPGKAITRTMDEARALAEELFERAKAGEDFDALVRQYTDDSYPGKYKMANFGIPVDPSGEVFARDRMVAAFGDVGFPLKVGEIGLASYDPQKSKYGWHLIKRVE